jgi:hypothetical protein
MSSPASSSKRKQDEVDDPSCTCAVCLEVLLDPVTLSCGHSLDQACLERVLQMAEAGRGQRACPTCREAIPAKVPGVSVQMRDMIEKFYPQQVGQTAKP